MGMMKSLILTFGQLLRLQTGPQALPYSLPWLIVSLILLTFLPIVMALGNGPWVNLLFLSAITHGFTFLAAYLILYFYKKSQRFVQTAFAMAGCLFLLNLIMFALTTLVPPISNGLGFSPKPLLYVLLLIGSGWTLLVQGNIYRHALEVRLGVGMLITLAVSFALAVLLMALKVVVVGA